MNLKRRDEAREVNESLELSWHAFDTSEKHVQS